jgi:chitin synthase
MTVMYLNKHLNAKKLSSHMWFFEGFCRLFHPKYCCFIDVGTVPDELGIVNYYKALEGDENLGGVSGFLGLYFDVEEEDETEKEKNRKKKEEKEKINE